MKESITGLLKIIDSLSEWSGKIVSWILLIMIVVISYDTAARYLFNAPTIWAFDLSCMLFGTYFMIGTVWTLKKEEHVRIDLIYGKLSRRQKAILDAVFDVVLFFPYVIACFIYSAKYAANSWAILERSWQSVWYPPLYPFKTVIPIAFLLLTLQGMAHFIRNISVIIEKPTSP